MCTIPNVIASHIHVNSGNKDKLVNSTGLEVSANLTLLQAADTSNCIPSADYSDIVDVVNGIVDKACSLFPFCELLLMILYDVTISASLIDMCTRWQGGSIAGKANNTPFSNINSTIKKYCVSHAAPLHVK